MTELPKGPGMEVSRQVNEPGVYRHEASGKELIVLPDGNSTAQQDALVRMGYVKVAEAPSRPELAKMQAAQLAKDLEAEKKGETPEPYMVPGTQEVVFNGTATDIGGQGDALAAKDAEIEALKAEAAAPVEEKQTKEEKGK